MSENEQKGIINEETTKLSLLKWQKASGIDEVLSDEPINRFTDSIEKKHSLMSTDQEDSSSEFQPTQKVASLSERVNDSVLLASEAASLKELKKVLSSFEGCALKTTATNLVFSDGSEKAQVMLVGEAPGAEEDRIGKPFVGASGQLLDKMLNSIGLDRNSVYISNILPWRPPGNRTPTPSEINSCLPFIQRHIELINPRVLILVGGTSAKALLDKREGIMRLRGRWFDYRKHTTGTSIPTMPIFHPAFLLRSPSQKSNAWKDLLDIRKTLAERTALE
ncbi:MAG: uracil-DNA glycosylase [Rhodospirillaceae bacterium]|nr:uracil-DNA glycosylase [Rhodospirillaceae bacterium]|tara:strand:- start:150 stop:983 length:834 start_codon:yes stop_codon:yes gene_type:complete